MLVFTIHFHLPFVPQSLGLILNYLKGIAINKTALLERSKKKKEDIKKKSKPQPLTNSNSQH